MLHPDSVIGHAALGYSQIPVIDEAHCIAFRFYRHRIPGGAYAVVVIQYAACAVGSHPFVGGRVIHHSVACPRQYLNIVAIVKTPLNKQYMTVVIRLHRR